jgi:plasmid maintenance system antidote protein VapI
MDEQTLSLRQAAKAIGVAASTLSALLKAEASLQAAVVGRGSRNSLRINLDQLQQAWRGLQGEPDQGEPQSDRQRYRLERIRHLWFQVAGERARLDEAAAALVDVAELEAVHREELATVAAAAQQWIEDAAAIAPGLPTGEAQIRLQELTHAALRRLADAHTETTAEAPPEPACIAFPADNPPTLWTLRGDLEAVRAEHRQLNLRVQRGELEPVAAAVDRLFTEGRRLRDGWQRAAENLGLRARLLRDREAFKAAAITELTRAGLLA